MSQTNKQENKSPYYMARKEKELTREEVCYDKLNNLISPNKLEKLENGRMYFNPDDVLLLAEAYEKPELCNYYCSHECPIGKKYVPEIEVKDLSRIVLEMLASLNSVESEKNRLIEITADGTISSDELKDFIVIQEKLEHISMTVEALQLWTEKMISSIK